ncbi:MAG: response regulator [Candidatus Thiodiazotropha sp.]
MPDTPRPRILFVDSDPNQLQSLKRTLRDNRDRWELAYVERASNALDAIQQKPVDIVVSETHLDGMEGPDLLKEIQSHHPATIRLLFSGETLHTPAREVVHHAHQFIAKPCDTQQLIETLERVIRLRAQLNNTEMLSLVGGLGTLGSLPAVYQRLIQTLQSENTTLSEIGKIVGEDMGMTTKLLQMVNSAFFGLPRKVTSPEHAVSLLGTEMVSSLVLGASVFSQLAPQVVDAFELDRLWQHSQSVSSLVHLLGKTLGLSQQQLEVPIMAGLLHDLGKLILASGNGEASLRIVTLAKSQDKPLFALETEALWRHHATIGAYLMGLWGLPLEAVEAVAHHHSPEQQTMNQTSKLLVFAANQLYHSIIDPGETDRSDIPVDPLMSLLGESVYDNWIRITQEYRDGQTD